MSRQQKRTFGSTGRRGRGNNKQSRPRPTISNTRQNAGKPMQTQTSARVQVADESREQEMIVGRRPVIEALKANTTLNKILMAEGVETGSVVEILSKAKERSIIVQRVPRKKLDQLAPDTNHQGVLAYMAAKEYVDVEDLIEIARSSDKPGLIVVLDEIEDPHNLGSILRSADGAGAHGVVISKRRSAPLTATVSKASAGAIEHMPVARVASISQAIQQLQKAGFWAVGTDVETNKRYDQIRYEGPTVLVIGNEGKGLSRLVKERCDFLVKLPMLGQVQSLNAGVAAGILLYEIVRQRFQA
ncbi:23S rRNA (guanosine(2251)-2'-O)-methyltransferase RlmB [Fodinisporobacter ferrooxydans]|uniref:23S rRNA (Guanosine(2251)-2'-O)-methyltransferase RlmB n=1 Tax=Fodinisporobacter ferrooxydans TaxID=2901836 RepID=A0ABY4CNN8_9BACL|nr:23S rRNA (guanosine(2251)-2'-O)-methyltransferase RlmB [Alicyclobacillaceae bacterium MYW30-H2]